MANHLREAIGRGDFIVTCEVLPGRGAREVNQEKEFETARALYGTGRVHAISVTDNPGGNPALLADTFAADLLAAGVDPLVHMSCKDRNRNQVQSQLYSLARQGIDNVLAMAGDYPSSGWCGRARPVFDLDSVQMLAMLRQMNEGLIHRTPRGDIQDQPGNFFMGAVVSPFKWTEAESLTQYMKLKKKIAAGAEFLISQVGYDARKMQELLFFLQDHGFSVPAIANIYLLVPGVARMMNRGEIPGCYVSDELLAVIEKDGQAKDKGRARRCLHAAKMIAVARGMGYAGVHIGGVGLTADVLNYLLDTADELQGEWCQWARELQYGKPDGWYYYQSEVDEKGLATGLNSRALRPRKELDNRREIMKGYGLSRFFHRLALTRGKGLYSLLKRNMDRRDRKKGLRRKHGFEHRQKVSLYGCIDCGDCGLEATGYSCPMSACPKSQRNGPCGGSFDGWCEVYPQERFCIYYKAYHRLKKYDELHKLDLFITPPNNWDYNQTSGWSNYTHERDNAANRQYLE